MVKQVVSRELSRIRTTADLAHILQVSPETLRKGFVSQEKISLSIFISRTRIERAMDLLSNSEMECKEICLAIGFSRADVGARRFKSQTGLTMEEYRKLGAGAKAKGLDRSLR
jgi:two-component system response regulator YesN